MDFLSLAKQRCSVRKYKKDAVEAVKNIANYITADNENDGVAKVIDKFIFAETEVA